MEFESRLQLIEYLDTLIGRKFRGSSRDYAKKLGVSDATFFRLLKHIREKYRTEINYNRTEGRYEFSQKGRLFIGFLPDNIVESQVLRNFQKNKLTEK
jgi:hypothetical protein